MTGIATAGDTKGPPCANITDSLVTDYYSPAATPDLRWTFVLGAPSCDSVSYRLEIYSFDGQTLLDTLTQPPTSGSTNVEFTYTFSGTAPSNGVCLVGETIRKGKVADRAPNSGCLPVDPTSSGGGSGFE